MSELYPIASPGSLVMGHNVFAINITGGNINSVFVEHDVIKLNKYGLV